MGIIIDDTVYGKWHVVVETTAPTREATITLFENKVAQLKQENWPNSIGSGADFVNDTSYSGHVISPRSAPFSVDEIDALRKWLSDKEIFGAFP